MIEIYYKSQHNILKTIQSDTHVQIAVQIIEAEKKTPTYQNFKAPTAIKVRVFHQVAKIITNV